MFFIIFQPILIVELRVHRSQLLSLGGVDDVFLAGPVASVQVVVDELGFGVGTAQVFETDLLDVDGGYLLRVVAVYHEAEVGHVGEVGRAVDVVHLDTAQGAVLFVAVHLAGMGHEDDEALVEDGETSQLVQGVGDVGHFRLPRFQMLLQAVHGVDDEDAHPFAAHHLAGFLQDVVDAVAPVVGQDVRHVAVQPAHCLPVDGFRHARSGGEAVAGQLLRQLVQMVGDGHVFGAEEGDFPLVAQAEAQHQLVGEFGLAVAGASGHHQQAAGLEGAVFVEVVPAGVGTPLQAVLVEGAQVVAAVFGGEDAFQGHFFGLLDADAEAFGAVFHQMLVGILATLAEVHDAAAFHSDAAREFLPERLPCRVLVYGDVDGLLVFEVRLHEAVQPREVALGAGGHGDDVLASGGDDGCRVELAFGDDALRGAEDAVHVVGDELGPLHHHEVLQGAAVLGVDERPVLEVVEADAVLLLAALREAHRLFGDAQGAQQLLRQAADGGPVAFQVLGELHPGRVEGGTAEVLGRCGGLPVHVAALLLEAFFGVVGHVELVAAVVAVAQAFVQVYGE